MKQWLISKIPMWVLRYLSWRNAHIYLAGHHYRTLFFYWADLEVSWRQVQITLRCKPVPRCPPKKPVGVPEWLANEPESYGYKDEPEEGDKDD